MTANIPIYSNPISLWWVSRLMPNLRSWAKHLACKPSQAHLKNIWNRCYRDFCKVSSSQKSVIPDLCNATEKDFIIRTHLSISLHLSCPVNPVGFSSNETARCEKRDTIHITVARIAERIIAHHHYKIPLNESICLSIYKRWIVFLMESRLN